MLNLLEDLTISQITGLSLVEVEGLKISTP